MVVAAAHLPGKVPEGQRISETELVAGIREAGGDAVFVPAVEAIVEYLVRTLQPGDRVLLLGNRAQLAAARALLAGEAGRPG